MKVRLLETIHEEREIDVEFPIYSVKSVHEHGIFIRKYRKVEAVIGSKFSLWKETVIGIHGNEVYVNTTWPYKFDDDKSIDENLGRTICASNAKEFNDVVDRAIEILIGLKEKQG